MSSLGVVECGFLKEFPLSGMIGMHVWPTSTVLFIYRSRNGGQHKQHSHNDLMVFASSHTFEQYSVYQNIL